MNRRGFLQLLGMGAVGAVASQIELDPERALWIPGQRTFFIPDTPRVLGWDLASDQDATAWRWSGNSLLTIDRITQEALKVLERNLAFAQKINRHYDMAFAAQRDMAVQLPKPGGTIEVRKPARFIVPEYAGLLTHEGFTPVEPVDGETFRRRFRS